ncbi:unnamed protein product, partial [Porites evermanni]
ANLKISKGQAVILVLGVKLQVQAKEFPMTKANLEMSKAQAVILQVLGEKLQVQAKEFSMTKDGLQTFNEVFRIFGLSTNGVSEGSRSAQGSIRGIPGCFEGVPWVFWACAEFYRYPIRNTISIKGQAVILVLGVKLQVQAKEFPMTKV